MSSPPTSSPNNHSVLENTTNNHHLLHPLPCPRCNSSNTKFCYYNNYSLSQPRHFCKACKRYWTRGGTLRNVPVGGGCRKNKRQKRPSGSASTSNPKMDLPPQPISNNGPLFYSNPVEPLDFPFSGFRSTRVCGDSNSGFDFQPKVNGLGLGFSAGLMAANHHQQVLNKSQPLTSGHDSMFYCASSGFASSSSTMASLLASTFEHPKFGSNGGPGLMSYKEMGKDLELEGDPNGMGWNTDQNPNPTYYSDPSSLLGAWFDPSNSNMGSSVPSLI